MVSDIIIFFKVNLGQFEPPMSLLENPDLIINGALFGINTQAYLIGYNEAGEQNVSYKECLKSD